MISFIEWNLDILYIRKIQSSLASLSSKHSLTYSNEGGLEQTATDSHLEGSVAMIWMQGLGDYLCPAVVEHKQSHLREVNILYHCV